MSEKVVSGRGGGLVVLLTVTLSTFLTPFSSSSFNIVLPTLGREFSLDAITMTWSSLAYLLTTAMFLVPFGKLADMYGRKKVFVLGLGVYTIASFLLATFTNASTIILLRAFQGIGAAMIFGTGIAILVSVFPSERKGAVLGINAAAVYIGLTLGPFLGGFLATNVGWRSVIYAGGFVGIASMIMVVSNIRGEWREEHVGRFDIFGSAVYSLMLLSLMYGFSLLPDSSSFLPILLGVALVIIFLKIEEKAKAPVLDINLFKNNRVFTMSNLAALINFSSTFALTFLLSFYLQYIQRMTAQEAGVIMIASPVVQAVFSPITGRLSDRIDPQKLSSVGMALTSLALGLFTLLDNNTQIAYVIGCLVLLGFGLALFSSPNTNTVMSSVDKRLYGVASSTLGTVRLTGQMLSTGLSMLIFAVFIGRSQIIPEVYPQLLISIKIIFTIFAFFCLIGIIPSLSRAKNLDNN